MTRHESKSLLVTAFFLMVLMTLIGAGLLPGSPEPEQVVARGPEHYVPDVQFLQYLEYRARLEQGGMNCQ